MNIDKDIEELAFKDRKKLANLNVIDLLDIIEFLQIDRKHWINQYTSAHNDYVCLQQENTKLKDRIDKAIEYVEKCNPDVDLHNMFLNENYISNYGACELLEILKGDKDDNRK